MDWSSVSRLIPEVGVLAVVGYFALKGIEIFREIVKQVDEEHHEALIILAKSIDKNTEVGENQIELSQGLMEYIVGHNGRATEQFKATTEQNKSTAHMMNKTSEHLEKLGTAFYSSQHQRALDTKSILDAVSALDNRTIKEQTVEHQTIEKQDNR